MIGAWNGGRVWPGGPSDRRGPSTVDAHRNRPAGAALAVVDRPVVDGPAVEELRGGATGEPTVAGPAPGGQVPAVPRGGGGPTPAPDRPAPPPLGGGKGP